ncbi:magnesium and cobalt transport protein CorA [Methanococcus aeolicus Nankai-3]|uniref:Magnesium transport protein CorA n=1 Tax=Methanococcus aeolicus (strain ATCC BAA-1280 / DSM 17508 / OCM 812 / Nankai-3) TaxID=419665 RepID=A6USX4_META3|nr:magnesium/cobalt transporter CorA [Methanococcus aeolicus]ABR55596.1 magnesium and cobalt transport protein CorA [Methanococcus aeolicus Nankai-3]
MLKIIGYDGEEIETMGPEEINNENYNVIWVDCYDPSDEELLQLSKNIGIEIEELKAGLDELEVPRVEEEDDYYLIVYKAPLFEEDITTTSFGIFIKDNIILTIHIDKINSLGKIYSLLKTKKPKTFLDRGKGFFLYSLLNQITISYSRIMLNLDDELDRLEEVLLKHQDQNITTEILQLRKTLVYFHKALVSNKDVLSILKRKYLPITTQDDREHIEDLYYDTLQLIDMETTYRELLVSTMDMGISLENIRMNQKMKILTMITALFALPVWITGIYGMNFKYMPLLNNPYGFWVIFGITIMSIMLVLYVFSIEKWIK